jgi:hypothetical protein
MKYDPFDADADPFKPPAVSTEVACLHCGQEYGSYLIEWRVVTTVDGSEHGFWCCPTPDCDGKGFGFDLLPLDPEYQDENGGWVVDEEAADDDSDFVGNEFGDSTDASQRPDREDHEDIPW